MVKEIILVPARTFSEFSVLPNGETTEECMLSNVNLETELAGIHLSIPLLSAAMMSVTGEEMVLELGRRGGIGILPNKMSVEEQAGIVRKAKQYEMEFVEKPILAGADETIGAVIERIEQHGHSTVPVVDEFRKFLGMFELEKYWATDLGIDEPVTKAMTKFRKRGSGIDYVENPSIKIAEVKKLLQNAKGKYIVVLDDQQRFRKLAFKQDIEKISVGAAISTHKGWQERVEANMAEGVDMVVVDTSDGYNVFAKKVVEGYRKKWRGSGVPICAGNVVTYDGAMYLMKAGADIIKLGMSSGSICTTRREKAVGRAPMAALIDCAMARDNYFIGSKGKYVPIIWDGGASCAADFIIALTIADAVMAGGYFNHFYESAGEKYDREGKMTEKESEMVTVATWGEGSARARNYGRYSQTRRTFFTEGEEGRIPYLGRLKPNLEKDLNKIRAGLGNAGCRNLSEYRQNAVLELMSPRAQGVVGDVHNITVHDK